MLLHSSLIVICVFQFILSAKLSCRDDSGFPVDWFINYKIPKLEKRNDIFGEGYGYAYLNSAIPSSKWTLSPKNISSQTSMLGYTLEEFYNNRESLTYLIYNDENPHSNSSSVGHTKGIVMFDDVSGFWIIHSIPKFPYVDTYVYPRNALENGQSVLCISFATNALNEIGKQLLYNSPSIYESHLSIDGLDEDVKSLFTSKPSFVKKAPFHRTTDINSLSGQRFTIFAKDNQFNDDLYSALIAPDFQTSLFVETWRRGSGTPMPPSCQSPYMILNVLTIHLASLGLKDTDIQFKYTEDHSKWAISANSPNKWICIGDINRMESQKKRGGGAACFMNPLIWKAFYSSISSLDSC